jgi:6-phosphogluconolactonase
MPKIQILKSPEELTQAAATLFTKLGSKSIAEKGRFTAVLSGGSTPLSLFRTLAKNKYDQSLDWNKVHFFWGDERAVPPDHDDSNYLQAARELLIPRSIAEGQIHRIQAELDPDQAAAAYQAEIHEFFQEPLPSFDLILLGLGGDSHTASLFPETALVINPGNLLVGANWVPKLETWRISFTPKLINQAKTVVFLANGEGKSGAVKSILDGQRNPVFYPAQLIQPEDGDLIWLLDQAAASQLDT